MTPVQKWLVVEGFNKAELIHVCYDLKDVKDAIVSLIDMGCKPEDVLVFPVSAAIPFKFKKVEAVEISL